MQLTKKLNQLADEKISKIIKLRKTAKKEKNWGELQLRLKHPQRKIFSYLTIESSKVSLGDSTTIIY